MHKGVTSALVALLVFVVTPLAIADADQPPLISKAATEQWLQASRQIADAELMPTDLDWPLTLDRQELMDAAEQLLSEAGVWQDLQDMLAQHNMTFGEWLAYSFRLGVAGVADAMQEQLPTLIEQVQSVLDMLRSGMLELPDQDLVKQMEMSVLLMEQAEQVSEQELAVYREFKPRFEALISEYPAWAELLDAAPDEL
ncbi:hypothetical protein [Aliagarivorans marinus]|uniref:hypothetical protein n=1 Tax=Aliagarivorans marinus TaxID=561965 RepID=UPI00041BC096|nr:hypothetical protein [Aliagarivorans marinus]